MKEGLDCYSHRKIGHTWRMRADQERCHSSWRKERAVTGTKQRLMQARSVRELEGSGKDVEEGREKSYLKKAGRVRNRGSPRWCRTAQT